VAAVQGLGHVWVPGTVVEDQSPHEARVRAQLVGHVHDLDHVQVDGRALAESEHRVRHRLRHSVRHLRGQLGAQGGAGDGEEQLPVMLDLGLGYLRGEGGGGRGLSLSRRTHRWAGDKGGGGPGREADVSSDRDCPAGTRNGGRHPP